MAQLLLQPFIQQLTMVLLKEFGMATKLDAGCMKVQTKKDVRDFVAACAELRFWEREKKV